jgi:sugar/nucleoside kinase (ribokinase family)
MIDVACIGILVADLITKSVDSLPEKGKLGFVDEILLNTGGVAQTTSIVLAKLGTNVSIIGKIGSDLFGDYIISNLQKYGVDHRGLMRSKNQNTSKTIVLVDSKGERTFLYLPGSNGEFSEKDINWSIVNEAKHVHIAGAFLMPSFDGENTTATLKKAKKMGKTTSMDTAWDQTGRWMNLIQPSLKYIDYFLPSYTEACVMVSEKDPEKICDIFLNEGVKMVGLKLGENGCIIATKKRKIRCAPFIVKEIDSTGAGDSWVGGFLTGMMKGWSFEKCGTFANAVGAATVRTVGGGNGIESIEQINREIIQGGKQCR